MRVATGEHVCHAMRKILAVLAIVPSAQFAVAKHAIRLRDALEALRGGVPFGVVLMNCAIGMQVQREALVGLRDGRFVCSGVDAESAVMVRGWSAGANRHRCGLGGTRTAVVSCGWLLARSLSILAYGFSRCIIHMLRVTPTVNCASA